ncbi:MAG: T9SS type A sorting domain-containing protein [Taibaiella sp.]|nr:T9SS type A sorting domain-containing protein [Taibaiella sp.]
MKYKPFFKLLLPAATIVTILICNNGYSQISNCNGFIKGNYLEAGINWNGAFGSSTPPPADYHPAGQSTLHNAAACGGAATADSAIGFIADPGKDGWETGANPFYGDFLLPGSPHEGWSYMTDGVQTNAWNSDAAMSDTLTNNSISSILGYADSAGIKQIKTQAIKDGMYITHFFSIDTGSLLINIQVLIENTGLSTHTNVYYMRTVNPHNDQATSSIADTKNKVEYSLPDSLNRSVVSTRGTVLTDAYLSIGTQDSRARGFIYKNTGLPTTTTIDNIFSGDPNFLYDKNDSSVNNTSVGLIYDLGNILSGGGVNINFVYAFNTAAIDSNLNSHVRVVNVNTFPKYNIYPNPVHNGFRIDGPVASDKVILTDITGREIKELSPSTGNKYFTDGMPGGYYIVTVVNDHGQIVARLPLQKTN